MPPIRRGSDVREDDAILHSGDTAEGRAVALSDVHRSAGADDGHLGRSRGDRAGRLCDGLHRPGDGLVRRGGLSGLAGVIVRHSAHESLVGFITIDAILLDAGLLLESLHSGLGLAAEVTVHFQGRRDDGQLVQKLLQGLDVRTQRAFLEGPGAEGVGGDGSGRRGLDAGAFAVVDEGQLGPVLPGAILDLRLHAAIVEATPFHGIAVAHVVADVAVREQGQAHDLRQSADDAPVHPLLLAVFKHAGSGLVRAAVGAILAGVLLVVTDGLQHTDAATGPGIALAAAHTVCHDLLFGNVLLIAAGAAGAVVRGILFGLAGQDKGAGLVDAGAVPIRTLLFSHLETPIGKVLVGEWGVDTIVFRHEMILLEKK